MSLSPLQEEVYFWYLSKAHDQYNESEKLYALYKYPQAIICSYEAIEYSCKAICKYLDIEYSRKKHFLDMKTLAIMAFKIGKMWPEKESELYGLIPMILSYTNELRNISRYGIDEKNVPFVSPIKIFRKAHCEEVLKDAKTIRQILLMIEAKRKWGKQ